MNFQPPLLGLDFAPTVAMKAGRQRVWQCARCGLVAVQSDLAPGAMGECPACRHGEWWEQALPVAGLQNPATCIEGVTR